MIQRQQYIVGGQVQGVGFRPFVFRLAESLGLTGTVGNTSQGVCLEVQGDPAQLQHFAHRLRHELPPLASITRLHQCAIPPVADETAFRIIPSTGQHGHHVLISPDVATCAQCLADMRDPNNRRYRYPFTNCTDCGPRYTITRAIPYDRATTSMSCFPLCPACQAEYENPRDRRFHAQPNACPVCGPRLWLQDAKGTCLAEHYEAIQHTAHKLHQGEIVAIKGLGGFHLVCNANDPEAIATLRQRKRRPHQSFAVMVPDLATARAIVCITEGSAEEALLSLPERPIVIVPARPESLPHSLAPDLSTLGVMLPYTPLHHLLLEAFALAGSNTSTEQGTSLPCLVMTSGNASGEPIALGNREAIHRLQAIATHFLLHDRDILIRTDDSVIAPAPYSAGTAQPPAPYHMLRRARGFVPKPLPLPALGGREPSILGVGGELKNTVCLTRGHEAFVSQHIGDLQNVEAFSFFQETIQHLENVLETRPEAVVCDLHPDYLSTLWAQESGLPLLRLQHHAAHIYSVLGEHAETQNTLKEPCLGLALDGTGYGTDGTIWGGELLYIDPTTVTPETQAQRLGRLKPLPLPGGDRAIREPWRLVSGLCGLLPDDASDHALVDNLRAFWETTLQYTLPHAETALATHRSLVELVQRQATPLTSSCGRLFDAVAALLGLCLQTTYEAQAAIRLETAQDQSIQSFCPFPLHERNGLLELDTHALFLHLFNRYRTGVSIGELARQFHLGIAQGFAELAYAAFRLTGVRNVALSGGVLHNMTVAEALPAALKQRGLIPLLPRALPAGDGGLAFGQTVWARLVLT